MAVSGRYCFLGKQIMYAVGKLFWKQPKSGKINCTSQCLHYAFEPVHKPQRVQANDKCV